MFDLKTGTEVSMPSLYDEFTERAYIDYKCGSPESMRLRDLLRAAMEAEGFMVYEAEWWHYDYKDWKQYPILNLSFSEIK
jgi:D-alanyl-D-alanine dipeptidase